MDDMNVDAVAEAIYRSRPRRIEWEDLSDIGWKAEYRHMARAAIKVMQQTVVRPEDIENTDCVPLTTRINHARLTGEE